MSKGNAASAAPSPAKTTPLIIIGIVLVVVVIGGWYFLSSPSSKSLSATANNNTKPSSSPVKNAIPANAPPGAQPPNQMGSPTATVTLEEFADFQCPQCGAMYPVFKEIDSMYGTRIHFIFRENPLSIPAHDKAYEAAVAAEAAGLQGQDKFWAMENMLFTNQRTWTAAQNYKEIWRGYAQSIGLDVNKWSDDQAGLQAKTRVNADLDRGKAIGVNSTPSLYINGQQVPFESFNVPALKGIIDGELAKSNPQQAATASNAAAANDGGTK